MVPPAMPNSNGSSVSTLSRIWMRVARCSSGSCFGRLMLPALIRTSASMLSQRSESNGMSGSTPCSFGWSVPTSGPRSARLRTFDSTAPCMKARLPPSSNCSVPVTSLSPTVPLNFS